MGRTTKDTRHVLCAEELDLADTQEMPTLEHTPSTPTPRRVSEADADPAWLAAMERLRRSFCASAEAAIVEDAHDLCFCVDCLSRANTPKDERGPT